MTNTARVRRVTDMDVLYRVKNAYRRYELTVQAGNDKLTAGGLRWRELGNVIRQFPPTAQITVRTCKR